LAAKETAQRQATRRIYPAATAQPPFETGHEGGEARRGGSERGVSHSLEAGRASHSSPPCRLGISSRVASRRMAMVAAEGSGRRDAEAELNLPPGFRFHPTDEELVVHYLCKKVGRQQLPVPIIAEVDLYKFDPWDLPGACQRVPLLCFLLCSVFLFSFSFSSATASKFSVFGYGVADLDRCACRAEKALFGRKEWYFFTPRDRKYPNGSRPNRAAGRGYWKATGADKPIAPKGNARPAGIKKALVFYSGKAPRGIKTDWIMHEYRLAGADRAPGKKGSQKLDEWVLCRLYNKKNNWEKVKAEEFVQEQQQEAKPHHRQNGEVMDALADTMSDSFQTHDSEIDNASGMQHNSFGGMVTVKEDNDWFTDLSLDEMQASYMNMGQMVNPNMCQAVNPAAGQDHAGYLQAIGAPQMRMWQTILPPF
ncbi:hypothetical protein EJB05_18529, partial [Eragrostis curvula]